MHPSIILKVSHYNECMRIAFAAILCGVTFQALAQTSSFQVHAFVSGRAVRVTSEPSWTKGGFGKFDVGAKETDDTNTEYLATAQLGFDWKPVNWLLIHADGIGRHEPSGVVGDNAGLVQAYVDVGTDKIRLRAGEFWLPTSRENIDPLWTSPYTVTFSALNSWIAQEVRPIGADLQWSPNFYFTVGATAFRGNDTMGTVLAERGWVLGNRLSVYNEVIALPPPDSVTKPFGSDLDNDNGYSARLRFQMPERAMIQVTRVENRAQIGVGSPPEEPWKTKFDVVSAEAGSTSPTVVAGEWMKGDTTVGFPGGTFNVPFETYYALVSRKQGAERYTARFEKFETGAGEQKKSNKATTLAWIHEANKAWRTALEYVKITGDDPRGSMLTLEFRFAY